MRSAGKIVQHSINSQFNSHMFPRTLKSWKLTLWRWDFMGTYLLTPGALYFFFLNVCPLNKLLAEKGNVLSPGMFSDQLHA
jgi:hypothetical protein